MTNIARHSDGTTAALTLELAGPAILRVTVADSGRCAEPWTPGVGIQSMYGRVEEIGGTLTIRTTPQGATITADLPLAIPADTGRSPHRPPHPEPTLTTTDDATEEITSGP
nr:hypothetical protein [Streptomyces sp. SA15]